MKIYCLLLLTWAVCSCHTTEVEADTSLEAVFIGKETLGCRLPVITFTKGLDQVRQITETNEDYQGYFSASNLDSAYWQPGRKLKLTIRKSKEFVACDALGIWHPIVEIVTIE